MSGDTAAAPVGPTSVVPTNGNTSKKKSALHCFHCNKYGFNRDELTDDKVPVGAFLCPECRVIPGVRGYRDPMKRGLVLVGGRNSLSYLEQNPPNVVRDAEEVTDPQTSSPTASDNDEAMILTPLI